MSTAQLRALHRAGMGIGGPAGGDVYFELAPGYYPSNRANANLVAPYGKEIGGGVAYDDVEVDDDALLKDDDETDAVDVKRAAQCANHG